MLTQEILTKSQIQDIIRKTGLMNTEIDQAIRQAEMSHGEQLREDGEPYLTEHVYPVTKLAIDFFKQRVTDDIIVAAILHDALEHDKNFTDHDFKSIFGDKAFKIVKGLSILRATSPEYDNLSKAERHNKQTQIYFKNLSNASFETKVLKLLDQINNLFWAITFKEEQIKIYLQETEEFYIPLAQATDIELYKTIINLYNNLKSKATKKGYI